MTDNPNENPINEKDKEILSLLTRACKKYTLRQVGASLLVSSKRIKAWKDGKENIPTHSRAVIKKCLLKIVNGK